MIILIFLIIFLAIRILSRAFYFSLLELIVLLAYFICLIGVLGKAKWGLLWGIGTGIGSILFYCFLTQGTWYTLILDCILIILGFLGFFLEKKISW